MVSNFQVPVGILQETKLTKSKAVARLNTKPPGKAKIVPFASLTRFLRPYNKMLAFSLKRPGTAQTIVFQPVPLLWHSVHGNQHWHPEG
jgi:hypothetical protein